jgi:hypothetical protein
MFMTGIGKILACYNLPFDVKMDRLLLMFLMIRLDIYLFIYV